MFKKLCIKALVTVLAAVMLLIWACASSNQKYADEYYQQGLDFYKSMEYERAIDSFAKALEINPKDKENYKFYFMRGRSYLRNRQYDQAVNDFSAAREKCPDRDKETQFLIFESRGNAYHALNKNDEAIKDFSDAIALNPKHEHIKYIYYNRGWVWQNKKEYQNASQDFYAALAIDSAFAPAYYGRAHSWYKMGNLERALEDAKAARRLEPTDKKYEDLVFELRAKMKK
ncbi:MAG: tetratricopeptide repeat protein [Desulfobacterales bacterium]|jgi:tetratricopeptide (TPR) repeat protein|nr:tetratricopeptide repeat protein [Deltaproteobacteria bacterium]